MKILLVNVLHTTLNEDKQTAVPATSPELCATQAAKSQGGVCCYKMWCLSAKRLTLWREYSIPSHFSIFLFNFYIQKHSYINSLTLEMDI